MQVNGAIIGHSTIQTKVQSSGLRPNPDRLKISIWDKSYPIQKCTWFIFIDFTFSVVYRNRVAFLTISHNLDQID